MMLSFSQLGEVVGIIQRAVCDIVASLSEADERALQSRQASDRQARSPCALYPALLFI